MDYRAAFKLITAVLQASRGPWFKVNACHAFGLPIYMTKCLNQSWKQRTWSNVTVHDFISCHWECMVELQRNADAPSISPPITTATLLACPWIEPCIHATSKEEDNADRHSSLAGGSEVPLHDTGTKDHIMVLTYVNMNSFPYHSWIYSWCMMSL